MRGEFIGVWSETWREIWLPLIEQPFGEDDFLLIAAGEIDHALAGAWGADAQSFDKPIGHPCSLGRRHEAGWRWELFRRGDGDIVGDGKEENQALLLAMGYRGGNCGACLQMCRFLVRLGTTRSRTDGTRLICSARLLSDHTRPSHRSRSRRAT